MVALELIGGLALLLVAGDLFVRGALGLAVWLGVSPLLIGLTVVGFGTSMPELFASVEAARIGSAGIAVGNVVGSNIANILLIVGLASVIAPLAVGPGMLRRDGLVLLAVSVLAVALCFLERLTTWVGLGLLVLLGIYLLRALGGERSATDETDPQQAPLTARPAWGSVMLVLAGLVGVALGAHLLVRGAVDVARDVGLSEAVIGLTVVAVGTSLPELATSVVAAMRRQSDVALGNVLGSNVFNVLGILGVTALVAPISVPAQIVRFDGWVMLAATVLLLVFALTRWRVERWEGIVLLGAYGAYLCAIVYGAV